MKEPLKHKCDFPIPPLRNQQVASHRTNAEFTALEGYLYKIFINSHNTEFSTYVVFCDKAEFDFMYLHPSGRYHPGVKLPITSSWPKRPISKRLTSILTPDPKPRWSILKCKGSQEALEKIHCCFQICSLSCCCVPPEQGLGHELRTWEPQLKRNLLKINFWEDNYSQDLLQRMQMQLSHHPYLFRGGLFSHNSTLFWRKVFREAHGS